MSAARLVEINPGLWVRPERVVSVIAHRDPYDGPVTVRVMIDENSTTGWQIDRWSDALILAAKIAAAVNTALEDQPDP